MGKMQIRLRAPWILAAGALFAAVSSGWAQGQSRAVVVKATRQAVAPPLSQITPVAPASSGDGFDPDDDATPRRRPIAARTVSDPVLQGPLDASPLILTPLTTDAALNTNAGVNVLGVGAGFSGFTVSTPVPDSNAAVGPTQVLQFVNDDFAVFNKSDGSVAYGPAHGNTLWQSLGAPCSSHANYDEVAQFDKLAQRWVILMPNFFSPTSLCFAVSTTSDAVNGSWNLYSFQPPKNTTVCNCVPYTDYPKLGVWPDGYYISFNEGWNGNYIGAEACVVDRNSMLSGNTATMQCFSNTGTSYGSFLPADVDGTTPPPSGSAEYYLNFDNNDQSLDLWQFHVDWTTPANSTFTGPTNIPVAAFTEPCGETAVELNYTTGDCIPQTGSSVTLDSYGDRLMYRLAYRNFGSSQSLVANHTVQVGTSSSQTGIRWYELQDTGSGFGLFQQGTYAPDSNYRWMGSIAMDGAGDIALGYSVSSSAMSPSIRYTGRVPSDPSGQMEGETDILSAAGITPGSATATYRWADYSSMAIDSADDCTFWYTTEYVPTTGSVWSTRIASFSFPSCAPPSFTVDPSPPSATVSAGGTASFNVAIAAVGSFNSAVTLTCSAPAGLNCSFAPTSANPGSSSTLTVTTGGSSAALVSSQGIMPSHPLYALWLGFPGLVLLGVGSVSLRSRKRWAAYLPLCVLVFGSVVLQVACGGGGNGKSGTTYTVNITATSGSIQKASSVTVTVQ
jgi:hypothetical protein